MPIPLSSPLLSSDIVGAVVSMERHATAGKTVHGMLELLQEVRRIEVSEEEWSVSSLYLSLNHHTFFSCRVGPDRRQGTHRS